MLSVSQLSKNYGGRDLFLELSFEVKPGQRVGLCGPNGCGKTTLLKILAGLEPASAGQTQIDSGFRLGYLGQEGQLNPEQTLHQAMSEVFEEVFKLEDQMRDCEAQMESAEGAELNSLLKRYDHLQQRYQHQDPHLMESRIATVTAGLGFSEADLSRRCDEFSGGWQMRGALSRLLLQAPDILLLDEPTNHLDLEGLEWLESFLLQSKFTVVTVSHDRAFLDKIVNRILAFEPGGLEEFAGNYSFYLEERELRREQRLKAYQQQQKELEKEERFIERFRSKATLASRVQSRQKRLDRMERLDAPTEDGKRLKATFAEAHHSAEEALLLRKVSKSYGDLQVLDSVELRLARQNRVAIVGRNGAGKSTLLKLVAGQEEPDEGSLKSGFRLTPVYYAQHQAESLDPTHTVLESLEEVAPPAATQTRLRTILGCMLFTGDEVHKPVGVLSGGERSRVALARCLVRPSNLLLLDEPTNHLDLVSRQALLEALQEYEQTILLVTHDRFFMDGLAEEVWEVAQGQVQVYGGNYSYYRYKKEQQRKRAEQLKEQELAEKKAAQKKNRTKKKAPVVSRGGWKLEALEKKIFTGEERLESITAELGEPEVYADAARVSALQKEYQELETQIQELMEIWDEMTS